MEFCFDVVSLFGLKFVEFVLLILVIVLLLVLVGNGVGI